MHAMVLSGCHGAHAIPDLDIPSSGEQLNGRLDTQTLLRSERIRNGNTAQSELKQDIPHPRPSQHAAHMNV